MPSVMQRIGTPNERHNKDAKYRATLENVDPTLTQYNEVLREKSVEAIYAEHLQPAFVAFNERQKRKDRRLDVKWGVSSALELQRAMDKKARTESKNKIDQKGRPPIREIVWQFGNPQQGYGCAGQTVESRQMAKLMLLECQVEAERRYPQLAWGDLLFHADEVSEDAQDEEHGSLHLHSEFVPLCFKNKQGPSVQVAMERCLKEMGFDTFQEWKHDLDNIMEEVLHRHGLERTVMDNHEAHQDSKEFHRQQRIKRQTKALEAQKAQAEQQAKELQAQLGAVQDQVSEAEKAAVFQNQLADAEAQRAVKEHTRATKASQRAAKANAQAQALEAQNEAMEAQLLAQQQRYDRNDAVIAAQEEALGLIQTVEEYEDRAVELLSQIEATEAAAKELPDAIRLFKRPEGESFVRQMLSFLDAFREFIRAGIARLRIFERIYGIPEYLQEPLSGPVQRRADALDATIADAKSRAVAGGPMSLEVEKPR